MTIIAFISQKGGVGKSTLSRAVAVEASKQKFNVLLADCDPQQATSYHWLQVRKKSKFRVEIFPTAQQALREAFKYDLLIIDGSARTSHATLEIAQKVDLVIQPTGASRADLAPAVKEFNALVKAKINKQKLLFVLNHIGSQAEEEIAKEYLIETGYSYLPIALPEKVSFRSIQNEGKSITEISYKTLRKQTKKLVESILDYV